MTNQTLKIAGLVLLALELVQCERAKSLIKPKPAIPTPYDYTLNLEFTPAAAAKLAAKHDSIVVANYYYGRATPSAMPKADDLHRIELGYSQIAYGETARRPHIISDKIDKSRFPEIIDQEPYVLITVFSAAPAGNPDEMIDCQSYTGSIKFLQTKPYTLTCDVFRN